MTDNMEWRNCHQTPLDNFIHNRASKGHIGGKQEEEQEFPAWILSAQVTPA